MKKLILVFVLVSTFIVNAQKKYSGKKLNFTVEQKVNLVLKKMTLNLDLTEKQQKQIRPIIKAQITKRVAELEKRKQNKIDNNELSVDEAYAMKIKRLDDKIFIKKSLKKILNKNQLKKFEERRKYMKGRGKKRGRIHCKS